MNFAKGAEESGYQIKDAAMLHTLSKDATIKELRQAIDALTNKDASILENASNARHVAEEAAKALGQPAAAVDAAGRAAEMAILHGKTALQAAKDALDKGTEVTGDTPLTPLTPESHMTEYGAAAAGVGVLALLGYLYATRRGGDSGAPTQRARSGTRKAKSGTMKGLVGLGRPPPRRRSPSPVRRPASARRKPVNINWDDPKMQRLLEELGGRGNTAKKKAARERAALLARYRNYNTFFRY